jgi:hypothetical protein
MQAKMTACFGKVSSLFSQFIILAGFYNNRRTGDERI